MKIKQSNFRIFLIILFFCISFLGYAQEENTSVLLVTYLQQLEKKFKIKFSFYDEDLNSILIKRINTSSLSDVLENIETQTQLDIEKLDQRYYTISIKTLNICGTLIDSFKNEKIRGASIEILEYSIIKHTNENGEFSIKNVPKNATIAIKYENFDTQFINAQDFKNKPCQTILLSETYEQLQEVVIYKYLTTGLLKEKDASIVLNTKDFGVLPGLIEPDVLQTVQALPGIKSIDETVSDINVRGGSNDQNLMLWNGIKLYQSGHFFGLISAFNPYTTDNVAIIKNGTSAMYADGVSAVINIKTKDELSNAFSGGAGINLISTDLYGQIPISKKVAFQFSGRRSITDFISTPTYRKFYEKAFQDSEVNNNDDDETEEIRRAEKFYFYDFSSKLLYDINNKHKLRLSLIAINNHLDYTESSNDTGTKNSNLKQKNLSIGVSLNSSWSTKLFSNISAYSTKYTLDSKNINVEDEQELYQTNDVFETAVKLSVNYNFSKKIDWNNGYQFNEVGITNTTNVLEPPYKSNIKDVIRTNAFLSEFTFNSINRKFWSRAGVRFNFIENINTFNRLIIEPRVNLNYKPHEYFKIDVLGEFKNQTTNQIIDLEQNFLGIEKRRWILSDEDTLPVTQSKQISLGASYEKEKIHISLEGFQKLVTGISISTQGFQNQDEFNDEIGQYNIKGFEFLINQKTKHFSNWLSYTHNNNKYIFKDITPSTFPNNLDIKHAISLASTYTNQHVKLGIGINYRTGKPYTQPQEDNNAVNTTTFPATINYKDANSSRTANYLRCDASALYNFQLNKNIRGSAGISILNIFNRKNILNTYYRLNDNDKVETIEKVSLGITPNASFRVFF